MLGRIRIGGIALAAVILAAASGPSVAPAGTDDGAILVKVRPIADFDPNARGVTRFGSLEWLGGLSLVSSDRRFGGISGLATFDGGRRLVAVSDYGDWFSARIVVDAHGRPTAVEDAALVRLKGSDGKPLSGKRGGDAEALAVAETDGGRTFLVSLETPGALLAFRGDPPFAVVPKRQSVPPAIAGAPSHGRGEALAVAPPGSPIAGAIVLFAEAAPAGAAAIPGGIRVGGRWKPLWLAASRSYAATDAAFLPNGDLLILERRFGLAAGIGMRLRRIAAASIAPGATLDGPVLLEAGFDHEIDNMEALAVDHDAGGTILTLMSDDNRSLLQRTLLLRFRLVGG